MKLAFVADDSGAQSIVHRADCADVKKARGPKDFPPFDFDNRVEVGWYVWDCIAEDDEQAVDMTTFKPCLDEFS